MMAVIFPKAFLPEQKRLSATPAEVMLTNLAMLPI